MKRSWILSSILSLSLLGGSLVPAFADDHNRDRNGDRNNSRNDQGNWKDRQGNSDRHQGRGNSSRGDWNRNDSQNRNRRDDDCDDRDSRNSNDRNWQNQNRRRDDNRYDGGYRGSNIGGYNDPYYGSNNGRYNDRYNDPYYNSGRRQETKNEWRNIAIASGAVGILGLLKHDQTLTFAGLGGALYSLNRYEQDRRSQNQIDRLRASYFDRDYFVRDGRRYDRRTVERNGQRYYQFTCS
jgi:hypothetical protein